MSKVGGSNQPDQSNANQRRFFEESVDWKTYLWNSQTKEFLGRNALSWGKIIAFYVVFYAFLACYFGVMMTVFYHTLYDDRPKYTSYNGESQLSTPGISMRPSLRLLQFNPSDPDTYAPLVESTNKLIETYAEVRNSNNLNNCSKGRRGGNSPCDFEEMVLIQNSPLSENGWGYSNSTPTVIIKINKVFDWVPQVYQATSKKLPEELRTYLSTMNNTVQYEMVWLWCKSKEGVNFSYLPYPGFPAHYFPFNNQKGFLAPMVAVSISNFTVDAEVRVKCFTYARNMKDVSFVFSLLENK